MMDLVYGGIAPGANRRCGAWFFRLYPASLLSGLNARRSPQREYWCGFRAFEGCRRFELRFYNTKYKAIRSVVQVATPVPKKSASSVHTGQPSVMAHASTGQSSASRTVIRRRMFASRTMALPLTLLWLLVFSQARLLSYVRL